MPRRRRDEAAQTRRQGLEAAEGEAQPQVQSESATQGETERKTRQRVHANLLTVAFRGPLAEKVRGMAESYQMSLARLIQDAVLRYEADIAGGYQPGAALAEWKVQKGQETTES